jgi:hypothetical protein
MEATLKAMNDKEMILISAQPDQTYFHWQVELYLYQFAKHGIQDRCYALFGYREQPSLAARKIASKFKNVFFYKDERVINIPNFYIPSVRPHILKQFFAQHPHLGKNVFYHDSDIFLVKLPKFEVMLDDDLSYVSDTVSYIGYDYVKGRADAYKEKYPDADNILDQMCAVAGVSIDLVKENQANSGGAQYLLKGIDAAFWSEVEDVCQKLYTLMKDYEAKYPLKPSDIQAWTADMWAVLWIYLKRGQVRLHTELDFSWAVNSISDYYTKNIFHLAGVSQDIASDKLYKAVYTNKNIFKEYNKNPTIFDHISPTNATYEYAKIVKEYASGLPPAVVTNNSKFLLKSNKPWSAVYVKDDTTTIIDSPVWRAVCKPYLIFNNGTAWVVTHSMYEKELVNGSGGLEFNSNDEVHEGWLHATVELLEMHTPTLSITEITTPPNTIHMTNQFKGTYEKGADILGKPSWRSKSNIIFYNGTQWTLTDIKYESELVIGSGGFISSVHDPWLNKWY